MGGVKFTKLSEVFMNKFVCLFFVVLFSVGLRAQGSKSTEYSYSMDQFKADVDNYKAPTSIEFAGKERKLSAIIKKDCAEADLKSFVVGDYNNYVFFTCQGESPNQSTSMKIAKINCHNAVLDTFLDKFKKGISCNKPEIITTLDLTLSEPDMLCCEKMSSGNGMYTDERFCVSTKTKLKESVTPQNKNIIAKAKCL
jgi:hypothetical protein